MSNSESEDSEPPTDPIRFLIDEYLEVANRGESFDREAWLILHAEYSDALRAFFDSHDQRMASTEDYSAAVPTKPVAPDEATLTSPAKLHEHATFLFTDRTNARDDRSGLGEKIRYFGDYELLNEIARGGMGIVYRARQLSLDRLVAIKMIRVGDSATVLERQRFRDEASSAARLDHPNIVAIYEIGEYKGQPYFSMQLIDGGTLATAIEQSTLPVDSKEDIQSVAKLMCSICKAVHYAHEFGVLHRDLKPSNILLDSHGTPFVADFGLAKLLFEDAGVTVTGAIIGTPAFMSPEQARGKSMLTVRSDVYALGAILYAILGRRSPFNSLTPMDAIRDVIHSKPIRITELNQNVDRDLATICHKCLEKEPELRYDSAASLANDLTRWSEGKTITARPTSLAETAWYWIRRNPQLAGIGALFAIFLLCNVAFIAMGFVKSAANSKALHVSQYANALSDIRMAIDTHDYTSAIQLLSNNRVPGTSGQSNAWEWNFLARQVPVDYQLAGYSTGRFSPDGKQFAALKQNPNAMGDTKMFYGLDVWMWNQNFNELDDEVSRAFSESHREPLDAVHLTLVKKANASKIFPYNARRFLMWSPNGRFLAYCDPTIVDVYDRENGSANRIELTNLGPRLNQSCVAWSTDSMKLLIADNDQIDVFSSSGSVLLHSFKFDYPGDMLSAAWTADDRIAISIDTKTYFFNESGQLLDTWEIAVRSWNRTGTHWVSVGSVGALNSPTPTRRVELGERSFGPFWVGDGSKLATVRGTEIEFLNLDGFESIGMQSFVWDTRSPFSSRNGLCDLGCYGTMVSKSDSLEQLYLHRFPQEKATTKTDLARDITALAAGPTGQFAAVAFSAGESGDAAISILDKDLRSTRILQAESVSIATLTWDPSGERVAALDQKGMLHIWEVKTGEVQLSCQLIEVENKETGIASYRSSCQLWWSPNGGYLASSCSYANNRSQWTGTVSVIRLEPLRFEKTQDFHRGLGWLPTSEFVMERASNSSDSHPQLYFSLFEHQRDGVEYRRTIEIFDPDGGLVRQLTQLPLPPVGSPSPILSRDEIIYLGRGEVYRPLAQKISLRGGYGVTPIYVGNDDELKFVSNDEGNRIFTLDRTNRLRVVDEREFQTLQSFPVENTRAASLDYRDGILWLADRQIVYRFNGTPIDLGSTATLVDRPVRGWVWFMGKISSALLMSGLLFLPWWLSSKEASVVLSSGLKWCCTLGAIVFGIVGMCTFSSEGLNSLRFDLNYEYSARIVELLVLLSTSIGFTNYIRLAILRRWTWELFLLLLHVMPLFILTAYRCWPTLNENWEDFWSAPVLLHVGFNVPYLAIGIEYSFRREKAKKQKVAKQTNSKSIYIQMLTNSLNALVLLLLAVAMWRPIWNYRFLVIQPDWVPFVGARIAGTTFFIAVGLYYIVSLWRVVTRKQHMSIASHASENSLMQASED